MVRTGRGEEQREVGVASANGLDQGSTRPYGAPPPRVARNAVRSTAIAAKAAGIERCASLTTAATARWRGLRLTTTESADAADAPAATDGAPWSMAPWSMSRWTSEAFTTRLPSVRSCSVRMP